MGRQLTALCLLFVVLWARRFLCIARRISRTQVPSVIILLGLVLMLPGAHATGPGDFLRATPMISGGLSGGMAVSSINIRGALQGSCPPANSRGHKLGYIAHTARTDILLHLLTKTLTCSSLRGAQERHNLSIFVVKFLTK